MAETIKKKISQTNLQAWLLSLGYENTKTIDELGQKIGLDFTDFLRTEQPYMTTAQIQVAKQSGMHIGAHSFDHALMQDKQQRDKMQAEIAKSIADIKNRFDTSVRSFAFPFTDAGVRADEIDKMRTSCDISFGTAGLKQDSAVQHYQRLPMEIGAYSAEQILKNAYFYYWMLRPIGKHKMQRT